VSVSAKSGTPSWSVSAPGSAQVVDPHTRTSVQSGILSPSTSHKAASCWSEQGPAVGCMTLSVEPGLPGSGAAMLAEAGRNAPATKPSARQTDRSTDATKTPHGNKGHCGRHSNARRHGRIFRAVNAPALYCPAATNRQGGAVASLGSCLRHQVRDSTKMSASNEQEQCRF
jgi:hypothetical protein